MIKSYKIKFKSINVWIHSLDSCSGDTVENHLISGTWSCFSVFNGIRSLGLSCALQLSPHYKITHHKNFYCSPKIDLIWFAVVLHLHYNNVRLFRSSIASTLQQCPHYYPFFIHSYLTLTRTRAVAGNGIIIESCYLSLLQTGIDLHFEMVLQLRLHCQPGNKNEMSHVFPSQLHKARINALKIHH